MAQPLVEATQLLFQLAQASIQQQQLVQSVQTHFHLHLVLQFLSQEALHQSDQAQLLVTT